MRAALLAIASLLVFPAWAQTHDRLVGTWKTGISLKFNG